jgi:DNA-directed RNA polymerase specialized sigma24 family protein
MAAQRRRAWDEKELGRIAAAQRHGLTTREIARRFDCNAGTIQKKLHELRSREPAEPAFSIFATR